MPTIVIPWRAQPSRLVALEAVTGWYRENLPAAEIVLVDSDEPVFNLSRARNLGISAVADPDEVVIINDADTLPQVDALADAVTGAPASGRVHLPYTAYHWLGADGTAQYAAGTPLEQCAHELVVGACSGIYVTTRRTWESHGGQDERFRGWGFEDAAWYLAHETLLAEPPRRSEGMVFALHHVAQPRAGAQYEANAALMEQYRAAAGDPDAMRQLVESASKARALPGS